MTHQVVKGWRIKLSGDHGYQWTESVETADKCRQRAEPVEEWFVAGETLEDRETAVALGGGRSKCCAIVGPVAWRYKTRVFVQALGYVWREVIETEEPDENEIGVRDLTTLHTGDEVEQLRAELNQWKTAALEREAIIVKSEELLRDLSKWIDDMDICPRPGYEIQQRIDAVLK